MTEQNKMPDLSIEVVKEQWSKTYNPDGKPDWSHIFPYYHEDIVFQDSIQKVVGFEKFEKMCNKLTKRCKSLQMDLHNVIKTDNIIMIEWTMRMIFRIFPSTPIHGASRLELAEDGRIINQRDYFDLWGDMYDRVPVYKQVYRFFMKLIFG